VFRSIVREARLRDGGVELELYVQPTQNIWWKYRQKNPKRDAGSSQTIRIQTQATVSRV
jgi:hypothetical protein